MKSLFNPYQTKYGEIDNAFNTDSQELCIYYLTYRCNTETTIRRYNKVNRKSIDPKYLKGLLELSKSHQKKLREKARKAKRKNARIAKRQKAEKLKIKKPEKLRNKKAKKLRNKKVKKLRNKKPSKPLKKKPKKLLMLL